MSFTDMAYNKAHDGSNAGGRNGARERPPEWADGLKQLYDSVVEEALPDSFKDLLDQLDAIPPARGQGGSRTSSDGPDTSQ